MINSSSARSHGSAEGRKEGLVRTFLLDHATAFRAKIRARSDNPGCTLDLILTGGEASDRTAAESLMQIPVAAPKTLLADKGYDGGRFRESLLVGEVLPIMPLCSNSKVPEHLDYRRYRDRNRIERICGKLNKQRRIATLYEKTVLSFESFLKLAAARLWSKCFVNATEEPGRIIGHSIDLANCITRRFIQ
jgi:transposase